MKNTIIYWFLYLLPKNAISRFLGYLADTNLPGFILNPFIKIFVKIYRIDMSEYEKNLGSFKTFNEFFTRSLKKESRSFSSDKREVISPVDGFIGEFGTIHKGCLIQAKGIDYSLEKLLENSEKAKEFEGGVFVTFYLAPHNYHRIHTVLSGSIRKATYIPGELWTVNPWGVQNIQSLFSRNERIISYLDTNVGQCALVKVGATVVGKIRVTYHSIASNVPGSKLLNITLPEPYPIKKGDELGVFEFGSTVICLFPSDVIQLENIKTGQIVKMGQTIGNLKSISR